GAVGGSISIWSIGEQFSDSYQNKDGTSANALDMNDAEENSGNAGTEAGGQAEGAVINTADMLGEYDADANANTANSRVSAGLSGAGARLTTDGPSKTKIAAKLAEGVDAE